jgi:multimeric flavodoxin WrbA
MTLPLIILSSSRKNSNTEKLVKNLLKDHQYELVDLLDYSVAPYNYDGLYPLEDRFPELTKKMIAADAIIFASPVYWYSMSGILKNFFDRFTDIVTIYKEQGRQMQGKKVFLIAVGTDKKLPEGFEVPFRRTAEYLQMRFIASYYCNTADMAQSLDSKDFLNKIQN